ncbi:MAG: hypothetical protein JWO06_3067, partial [Bacteroidota bacterium]|nr:hypothetical protein [Bacteroidota bacterium]
IKGTIESTSKEIDISLLPAGMYFINGVKFVKE